MDELNKDIFSEQIQMPLHVAIADKFLIMVEKYMKVLKQKYDADKRALANRSFFTQEQDRNIEMSDESDLDEDESDKSLDSDDDNLFESGDE